LFLAAVCLSSFSYIRGMSWGMTMDEVKKTERYDIFSPKDYKVDGLYALIYNDTDLKAYIVYFFFER
jgi:hypothetical protein